MKQMKMLNFVEVSAFKERQEDFGVVKISEENFSKRLRAERRST